MTYREELPFTATIRDWRSIAPAGPKWPDPARFRGTNRGPGY
jgi:hypothetical protein